MMTPALERKMFITTAYRFIPLSTEAISKLQKAWHQQATSLGLVGTILLSTEGFNLTLAGDRYQVNQFKAFLSRDDRCQAMFYKESESQTLPFRKLIVRIKDEIITMRYKSLSNVSVKKGDYLDPETLKAWLQEQRSFTILDVRNAEEVAMGSFRNSVHFNLQSFSEFPSALEEWPEKFKQQAIVTYCTGGIRCEKAAALMVQRGFQSVYQLKGGILHYFSQCQGDYFEGDCFLFDNRLSTRADANEMNAAEG